MASRVSSRLSSRVPAYASLPRHHKLDLDSRLGSNLHAVASTALAVVCVLSLWGVEASAAAAFSSSSPSTSATATHPLPLALRTSPLSFAALGMSLGYFAADLALVLRHAPALGGPEVVAHHAAALASLLVAAVTGHGHAHTLALLVSESTTPFVNARVYLERAGPAWKRGRCYAANGVAMLLAWAVARVGLFAAFFAHLAAFPGAGAAGVLAMAPAARALIAVVPPLLAALNAYWFCLIARGAWKTVVARRKTASAVEVMEVEVVREAAKTTTTAGAKKATAALSPPPSMPPTAACTVQLQPSSKQQQQLLLRSRRRSSEGKRSSSAGASASAATTVPLVAVTASSPSWSPPSSATAASLERAILHLWSLAPQPPAALPSLPPFPSLPALPPSFQSLPSPAAPFVAASDLAAALGCRVRQSQAGEALAGAAAACRERAERAQGFVADAWAAKRASAAAAFVR